MERDDIVQAEPAPKNTEAEISKERRPKKVYRKSEKEKPLSRRYPQPSPPSYELESSDIDDNCWDLDNKIINQPTPALCMCCSGII